MEQHNMKAKIIFLLAIVVVAAVLRLWQLGQVPNSLDWDEVSLGYNAYSIMRTGKDEYGKSFPIVLESFGDYKPALYTYLIIPFLPIFGLTPVAVRLPSALFGILAVLFTYLLVKELFKNDIGSPIRSGMTTESLGMAKETKIIEILALLAALLLAISPWSIQFSRVAFESNVGVALNLAGVVFFLKGLKKPVWFSLSAVFFALSLYVYQSEKVFVPLLLLILVGIHWKKFFSCFQCTTKTIDRDQGSGIRNQGFIIFAVAIFILIALPMTWYTFVNKNGLARAEGVSFLSNTSQLLQQQHIFIQADRQRGDIVGLLLDNHYVVYAKKIVQNYLSHYDLNWWFITGDLINRHHAPEMGLLYLADVPFLFAGFYFLFFSNVFTSDKRIKLFLLFWFLAAPVPASITNDVPHAVRTENFLPMFQLFTSLGIVGTFLFLQKNPGLRIRAQGITYGFYILFFLFYVFNFLYYLNQYFIQTNYFYAKDWIYGYQQLIDYLKPLQSQYNRIIVSDKDYLSQSYIFFLFYTKYSPQKYLAEGGTQVNGVTKFAKFEFRTFDYNQEKNTPALFVGTEADFPKNIKDSHDIYFPDGTVAMRVAEKK